MEKVKDSKGWLLLTIFLFLMNIVHGQSFNTEKELVDFIVKKVRNNEEISQPEIESMYYHSNPKEIVVRLLDYKKDSVEDVRSFILSSINEIAHISKSLDLRRLVLKYLLHTVDGYNGLGNDEIGYLPNYGKEDFDDSARAMVRRIATRIDVNSTIQLIAGYLELTDLIPMLKEKLIKNDSAFQIKVKKSPWLSKEDILREGFRTHRALARMGVKEEIEYCINLTKRVRREIYPKYHNPVYYDYIKELIYIRQPEVVDYLEELLYDKKFKISPYNGYVLGAYLIISDIFYIDNYIENMPGYKLPSGKYMSKEEYLKVVKKWLKENKGNYKINRDKF